MTGMCSPLGRPNLATFLPAGCNPSTTPSGLINDASARRKGGGPAWGRHMAFHVLASTEAPEAGATVPLGGPHERCLLAVLLADVGSVVPPTAWSRPDRWPGPAMLRMVCPSQRPDDRPLLGQYRDQFVAHPAAHDVAGA